MLSILAYEYEDQHLTGKWKLTKIGTIVLTTKVDVCSKRTSPGYNIFLQDKQIHKCYYPVHSDVCVTREGVILLCLYSISNCVHIVKESTTLYMKPKVKIASIVSVNMFMH